MFSFLLDSCINFELQEALYISGETYYCYKSPYKSTTFGLIAYEIEDVFPIDIWNFYTGEIDTLDLCFDYLELCSAQLEFYDSLAGQADWQNASKRFRFFRFFSGLGVIEYFIDSIILGNSKYNFLEYWVGIAHGNKTWGLSFFRQLFHDQFYLFSNFSDYSNPRINHEINFYNYVYWPLSIPNTRYDIIFPFFVSSHWDVLPFGSFWFSEEYKYSLPADFSNFFGDLSKSFSSSSYFWKRFLLFDYDLLVFSRISILLYFFCSLFFYFFYNYIIYFFWMFYLFVYIFFDLFKSNDTLNETIYNFWKSFCFFFFRHLKLLAISFISLILFIVDFIIEQYMWWFYYNGFWTYYAYVKLYKVRLGFLHFYVRYSLMYFWRSIYFSFQIFFNIIKLTAMRVPYVYSSILIYLFALNFLYYFFKNVPESFSRRLWSCYIWFLVNKYFVMHTDVIFKFFAIFNKYLKLYEKYYRFQSLNVVYYKYYAFFTSYYKRGSSFVIFEKFFKIKFNYVYFILSIIAFFFSKALARFVLFVVDNGEILEDNFVTFFKIVVNLRIWLLHFISKMVDYNFSGSLLKILKFPFDCIMFLILAFNRIFLMDLGVEMDPNFKYRNIFYSFLKLTCCCINLIFFNFVLLLLCYLPKIFFFF